VESLEVCNVIVCFVHGRKEFALYYINNENVFEKINIDVYGY